LWIFRRRGTLIGLVKVIKIFTEGSGKKDKRQACKSNVAVKLAFFLD